MSSQGGAYCRAGVSVFQHATEHKSHNSRTELALCHRVILDSVAHKWVTTRTPTVHQYFYGGRSWVARDTLHATPPQRRDQGYHATPWLTPKKTSNFPLLTNVSFGMMHLVTCTHHFFLPFHSSTEFLFVRVMKTRESRHRNRASGYICRWSAYSWARPRMQR